MEISHEGVNAIIREKQKYERMKENLTNATEKQENMIMNSKNSRKNELVTSDFNWLKDV